MNSSEKHRPLPPELRERLEQESPEERAELERIWHLLGEVRPLADGSPDADETWKALQEHLDASEAPRTSKSHRRAGDRTARRHERGRAKRRWAVAVAALVVVVLGGLLFWQQPVRVSAPAGERVAVTLPDGSSVELSSGTVLSYRRGFQVLPFVPAGRRAATLRGEAFFEVEEGTRPFVVETFNAQVEVVGTQFNIRAWPEASEHETQITLASGRVRVAAPQEDAERAVMLERPGQVSRVVGAAAPTAPQDTSLQRVLAWRQQGFAATSEPLSAIFAELERRYGTPITVRDRSVLSDSMTLFYPGQTDVETILHDICVTKGLKYRTTSQGYELFRKDTGVTK